jgi:hypothetical protein
LQSCPVGDALRHLWLAVRGGTTRAPSYRVLASAREPRRTGQRQPLRKMAGDFIRSRHSTADIAARSAHLSHCVQLTPAETQCDAYMSHARRPRSPWQGSHNKKGPTGAKGPNGGSTTRPCQGLIHTLFCLSISASQVRCGRKKMSASQPVPEQTSTGCCPKS